MLVNELFVALKSEMGRVAEAGLPADSAPREQLRHVWDSWAGWALATPEKRRALAVLTVAEDLADASLASAHDAYADIAALLERVMADGPLRGTSLGFVATMLGAIADATLDDLLAHPADPGAPDDRLQLAFDALWRALAGITTPPRS